MGRTESHGLRSVLAGLAGAALLAGSGCGGGRGDAVGEGPIRTTALPSAGTGTGGGGPVPGLSDLPLPTGVTGAPELPLASIGLLALFGNDRLTSAVSRPDGSLRFEAPPSDAQAQVSADQARDAIGTSRMPGVATAPALLGVWDHGDRPLVWVVLETQSADVGVVDARTGDLLGYFDGS